jgi:hypothetical protein
MLYGSLLLACVLAAHAGEAEPWYLNISQFAIPIRISDPARKAEIKELLLYVSRDQGHNWVLVARATPDKDGFPYRAPADGEYWFAVQTVDQQGKSDPLTTADLQVGQKIIVDTAKPDIQLRAERKGDEILVHWTIQEDNPLRETLRLEYQPVEATGDQWTLVAIQASRIGDATFKAPGSSGVRIRMQLKDKAEHLGIGEAFVAAALPAPVSPGPNPTWVAKENSVGPVPPQPQQVIPPYPAPPNRDPMIIPGGRDQAAVQATPVGYPTATAPTTPANVNSALPQLTIVRRDFVKLEFEVARCGPSGVGTVDVYLTTDDGMHWERTQHDVPVTMLAGTEYMAGMPLRGSVLVKLPQPEVPYGIYLVVKSKANLGEPPPTPGKLPQMRVEVDVKAPEAQLLLPPTPDPARENTLVFHWTAHDRNLDHNNAISLEYSETPNGPWRFIGGPTIPNTGHISWVVPGEIPTGRVYLKLTVRDLAGNVSVATTPEPGVLIDTVVPTVSHVSLGPGT